MLVKILGTVLLTICVQCVSASQIQVGRMVLPTTVTPLHYAIDINPDAANMRFSGEVKIDLKIHTPTQTIVLNAADLEFQKATLSGTGTATISFDKERETATLTFAKKLAVSEQTLDIHYTGLINQNAAGMLRWITTQPQAKSGRCLRSWKTPMRAPCFLAGMSRA